MTTKKYKIGIYTLGKTFLVNGKVTRSPFETIISERELPGFKLKIRTDGIDNYSIVDVTLPIIENKPVTIIVPKEENSVVNSTQDIKKKEKRGRPKLEKSEVKIEELESKSKSLLEKYSSGEI